ncbi:MAG: hypothetical protein R3E48_16595 [Burkholderiaceae bacterium]
MKCTCSNLLDALSLRNDLDRLRACALVSAALVLLSAAGMARAFAPFSSVDPGLGACRLVQVQTSAALDGTMTTRGSAACPGRTVSFETAFRPDSVGGSAGRFAEMLTDGATRARTGGRCSRDPFIFGAGAKCSHVKTSEQHADPKHRGSVDAFFARYPPPIARHLVGTQLKTVQLAYAKARKPPAPNAPTVNQASAALPGAAVSVVWTPPGEQDGRRYTEASLQMRARKWRPAGSDDKDWGVAQRLVRPALNPGRAVTARVKVPGLDIASTDATVLQRWEFRACAAHRFAKACTRPQIAVARVSLPQQRKGPRVGNLQAPKSAVQAVPPPGPGGAVRRGPAISR